MNIKLPCNWVLDNDGVWRLKYNRSYAAIATDHSYLVYNEYGGIEDYEKSNHKGVEANKQLAEGWLFNHGYLEYEETHAI